MSDGLVTQIWGASGEPVQREPTPSESSSNGRLLEWEWLRRLLNSHWNRFGDHYDAHHRLRICDDSGISPDIDHLECPAYSVGTECASPVGEPLLIKSVGMKEERMRLIKPIVLHCRWQVDT